MQQPGARFHPYRDQSPARAKGCLTCTHFRTNFACSHVLCERDGARKVVGVASQGCAAKLGEDRYYQRIGSSMMRMEHFQIADMFGRRAHPEIEFKFVQSSSDALSIELRNVGRGIARAPYVMLRVRRPYIAAPFPETGNVKDFPLPRLPNASMPDWGAFVGGMDQVIHPGVTLRFRAVALPPQFQGPVPTNCYVEEYRIGAAGATERAGRYEFDFKNGSFTNMGDGYGDW